MAKINTAVIVLKGHQIVPECSVKYLGVLIDTNLTFAPHIRRIAASCFWQIRQLWKIRRSLSVETAKTLVHAIWPQQIWAENWGLCPFGGGVAGSPSNTMWPVLRPTCSCMPSFILIRPTVWPQCTNVADRQTDRTTVRWHTANVYRFTNGRPKTKLM